MSKVRMRIALAAIGTVATIGAVATPAIANPNNSGSPPAAESLSYLSGPQSQAHWLGTVQAGSELDVGNLAAGPYNPGLPGYSAGYGKILLHNFPSTLPTAAPSFDYTGANAAGELRWYIQFTGGACQQTAAQQNSTPNSPQYQNAPCYIFGYPTTSTGDTQNGTGGAPFTWEMHKNGTVTYTTDWSVVLATFDSQPVNDVRVVADDSGQNAPYTDVISNVQYGGQFPTP